jgi:hypothetical protein
MAITQIKTTGIADDAVTVAKMADNSIDSAQYVDGSIDTAHIADSQITVAKMAANSIDSAQYVDGSIDPDHLANDAVTSAKLDNSIVMTGSLSAAQVNGGVTTTVVSSSATATTGQNHFISSACTLTLPASPSLGDTVMVAVGNFATAILGRNSQKIEGTAEDMTIDVARVGLTCVFTGSTYGWAIY